MASIVYRGAGHEARGEALAGKMAAGSAGPRSRPFERGLGLGRSWRVRDAAVGSVAVARFLSEVFGLC